MPKAENNNVLQVARKVAATIGADFFRAMAKHLAEALAADCLIVGEFVGGREERCRTVAAWMDGARAEFDFALAGSATAGVVLGKPCLCRSNAQTRFPSDSLVEAVRAHACIGVPLADRAGHPIGVLMALFRQPVTSSQPAKLLLETFAQRASMELARKQEEQKLRESEERYRVFIARNTDGMWRVEFNLPIPTDLPEEEQLQRILQTGYIAECNDAMARILGREKAEQLIGCGVDEIAPVNDPSFRHASLVAIRSGYRFATMEMTPPDSHGNRRHMLRTQWGIVEDGRLERIWGCTRDITDARCVESALDASEQRMTDLLEAMHLLVVLLDPEGAVAFCNRYLYRLTGWTPGDLLGNDWLDQMVPPDEHSRVKSEFAVGALTPDQPLHFESTLLGHDRSRRHISWDSTILLGHDREAAARALIGKDVTEFKALEEQFRQAQKLAGIGRLAGGVAHDFNNFLTVILGYASGLLDKLDSSDPAYIGLSEIKKAAEKGANLSRSLLTFSRRQLLRPRVVSLNALVEDSQHMLATLLGATIELITKLEPDSGSVRLDAGYFHQVLLNLALNARDALPHGGMLTISTSPVGVSGPLASVTGIPPGDYVRLTISDSGVGMPPEVREHLFEPFFTTKKMGKGTGLGLSTVYGIVTQSGGHILVDTEVGRGTTFSIYLPRVAGEPVEQEVPEYRPMPQGTETLLLVEERDDVRTLAATVLKELGYNVLEAAGAARAIELSRRESGNIHLMLASVSIPILSVDSLVELVQRFHPHLKVLFISGQGEAHLPKRATEPGFGFLQKPFTPLALAIKVREILDHE
jgi:two-component system, cell cycle sensor histidine kinase and response regulator CckA